VSLAKQICKSSAFEVSLSSLFQPFNCLEVNFSFSEPAEHTHKTIHFVTRPKPFPPTFQTLVNIFVLHQPTNIVIEICVRAKTESSIEIDARMAKKLDGLVWDNYLWVGPNTNELIVFREGQICKSCQGDFSTR